MFETNIEFKLLKVVGTKTDLGMITKIEEIGDDVYYVTFKKNDTEETYTLSGKTTIPVTF